MNGSMYRSSTCTEPLASSSIWIDFVPTGTFSWLNVVLKIVVGAQLLPTG
jgi:hypothetical protein